MSGFHARLFRRNIMKTKNELYLGIIILVFGFCLGLINSAIPAQTTPPAKKSALQPGQASGALTVGEATVKLSHAGVFIDKPADQKPTVLVLTDQELPVSGWSDSSDMIV